MVDCPGTCPGMPGLGYATALDSWATQVEVAAAASVFQVPVYYCKQENNKYRWHVVKPLTDKHQQPIVKCPELPTLDDNITLLKPTHFELLYYENSHYDAIVSATTSTAHPTLPTLSKSNSPTIILD